MKEVQKMAKDKLGIELIDDSSWSISDLWRKKKGAELSSVVGAG